jgi:flagellin
VTQNSLIFQIGPNAGQKVAVSLDKVSAQSLGRNVPNESGFASLNDINVLSPQGAEDAMKLVEHSIDGVNRVRAQLGAVQKNALESQLRSLAVAREELTNAESVIRDADMAAELSEFVRNQVISQSGMAMLGQAHQAPRNVLSLLQRA